jgi:hypothetical protein
MYLIDGGRSTKELQALLGISESDLLSQLEQLQATGIVQTRAVEHGSIHVSIDDKARRFVVQLIDLV